ncbi:DNA-binding protein [Candidatus Curtissbacteria bacterium]|nr:DNA-binding protein [Candidatus Curtissbacteria bacterium]
MVFNKTTGQILIRLSKGEELIENLTKFCQKHGIKTAQVMGIGAVLWADIGHYDLSKKEYLYKKYEHTMELTSLLGNVSEKDGKPYLHLHVNISDKDGKTYGGHLKEAVCAGTIEIFLTPIETTLNRRFDNETGLALWDLSSAK